MIIIVFIVVGFALIFMAFNRDDEYGTHIYETYKILYGSFIDDNFGASEKLIVSLILFLFYVLLMNLLISILANSYDFVQEHKVLTDSRTRLEMVLQVLAYRKIFDPRKARNCEKGYLIYCLNAIPEEDEEEQNDTFEGRVVMMKKMFQKNDEKIEDIKDKMEKMENMNRDMSNRMNKIEESTTKMARYMDGSRINQPPNSLINIIHKAGELPGSIINIIQKSVEHPNSLMDLVS